MRYQVRLTGSTTKGYYSVAPKLTSTYSWNIVFGGEMAVSEETRTYFENALNQ